MDSTINNGKITKVAALTVLFFFLLYWILWKVEYVVKIDKTVTALMITSSISEVSGDMTDVKEVKIKIKGSYNRSLMMNKKAVGLIECEYFIIEGFAVTQPQEISFYAACTIHLLTTRIIQYNRLESKGTTPYTFGWIYSSDNLESFVITPFEQYIENPSHTGSDVGGTSNWDNLTAICYPAETRGDAVKLMNDIMGYIQYMEFK